ncbi:MAG: hypothetical protein ABFC84_13335, partial [Veillonellales bacterium]
GGFIPVFKLVKAKIMSGGNLPTDIEKGLYPVGAPVEINTADHTAKILRYFEVKTEVAADATAIVFKYGDGYPTLLAADKIMIAPASYASVGTAITAGTVTVDATAGTQSVAIAAGTFGVVPVGTIFVEAADDTDIAAHVSTATLEGAVGHTLVLSQPITKNPELINGVEVKLVQGSADTLAVAYSGGVMTITLANTTATKNTAALIQSAIRALGTVGLIDFSAITATGTDWSEVGTTITKGQVFFAGGIAASGASVMKVKPNALLENDIYVDADTFAATATGVYAGDVYAERINWAVPACVKAALSQIFFDNSL